MKNSTMKDIMQLEFFKDKKIIITGHTGFKGSWLCQVASGLGASITGYALDSESNDCLFKKIKAESIVQSVIGDVRDYNRLQQVFDEVQPEMVFHLAAQPLVRESYQNPVYTYETNVMGTVNVLECIRNTPSVKSFVNVTTDKVYKNKEWLWGYREDEELNGYDPYSNSKSCSELITSSYVNSFFRDRNIAVSTARAGNVIGGGDFARDRIIPDCIRAAKEGKDIIVRNPYSTRPYQHVLEPLMAYLTIAMEQYEDKSFAGNYNVGPDDCDCINTGQLVNLFCKKWNAQTGMEVKWVNQYDGGPHEANFLKLDCSKMKNTFDWKPRWHVGTAVNKIIEWEQVYMQGGDISDCMNQQIGEYLNFGSISN